MIYGMALRIGIGFDNTIYPTSTQLKKFTYQTKLNNKEPKTLKKFYNSPLHSSCEPIEYSKHAIRKFKERGDTLYLLTTRNPSYGEEATRAYLNKHFEGIFDTIEFTDSKISYCRDESIDVMIDDNGILCNSLKLTQTLPIMFGDYPWSSDENGVVRMLSWQDANQFSYI